MAHTLIGYCCFIAVVAPVVVQCISVVGPKVLRPYSPYRVAVSGGSKGQSLYVAVEGRRANGEQFQQGREVQVQPAASRLFDLDVGDPGPGRYELVARSTSGPQFSSSAPLIYQPRSFCVFIQTDKRVYQPGDIINFRVIALDKYLLPLAGGVDVSVLDAGGSPVRQWASVPLDRGIITAELPLADEPALGEWTVQVEVRGQTYTRRVLVADYVMPRFQMDIEMPNEILFKDGRFVVNITAKHFNGLPVRGELTLSAYAVFFSGVLQPIFSSPSRKVVEFNGQTEVTYDLKTDLDLAEDAARPLVIEAVLEEKDTLIKQNVSARILLLRTPYRLKVTAPEHFKPLLPYNVQIELVDSSGKVMEADGEVSVERLWDDGAPVNVTAVPLRKGLATYSITPDKAHASSRLNLVVKYKEVSERVINVQESAPSGGQFLTIELLNRGVVGGEMRARISATEPMDLLNYAVVCRGDITYAKTLELNPARRSVDVTVPVIPAMAPGAIWLAWYPRLDPIVNTVVASALYAPQQQKLLQYDVSVSISGGGSRPGGAVELRVAAAESGAHVALLAEDTKAIAAGLAGNDGLGSGLDLHTIEREVESFSGLKHSFFKNEDHQPMQGLDLGGNTTAEVFRNAGLVILTDSIVIQGNRREETHIETGTRPPSAGPYAFSRLPPPPSPRFYLTVEPQPTWMLANFSLGKDGKGAVNRRTPITSGEYTVGAFAVHPTLGLGLASPETFTTGTPLAISAELPATLQKGEMLAAVITLTSTLTVATSVEVTFHNSEQYFEFEPLENNVEAAKKIELFRRLRVTVPAKGSISTAFLVTVVRSGEAPVIVEASGNGVSASLFRTIDVKDGYEEELWSWILLDGRRGVARGNVSLDVQAGTRLGAASLRAAGDILAPALHASRAAPEPAADPAYALRPLAVASVLLDYLQATERDEVAITGEARAQAASGYQRLMAYRKSDGSFAAEIDHEAQGDVWMTAIATRWLSRSARYVEVSPGSAVAAARWLVDTQESDGSWTPPHFSMTHDPRAQRPLPLTAHALLALLSVQSPETLHKNAINKAVDLLARGLSEELDSYTLAMIASALAATRHPSARQALQMLEPHINLSETGSMKWWGRKLSGSEHRNPWLRANSAEASTAAWGLRAMLAANLIEEAIPVARYLLAAYKPYDLDPDVLESLSELAQQIKSTTKLRVLVNVTGSEEPRQFNIDDDNALIIQTQLVRNVRTASARTEGRGLAVLALSAEGGTNVTAAWPRFTLDPRVDAVSTRDRLQLSICVGFVPQGNETVSGFTLLTVQLPSGYVADINTLTELTAASHVTSARLEESGTRVLAWLRALEPRERCATLAAPRAMPVARQRPGHATLRDLYDSSHRARVFFQPITAHACDVCRAWDSCSRVCGSIAEQRASDDARTNRPDGDSATANLASPLLALAFAILLTLR